ncbi:TetR/AcrR family transcriptional regulator [Rhodococcoides yunnanense]|uniref:TetR/AcrR family transcriptional regulator n=1 Tax=Rhodococcoides yunnanense TaxID=278209 RepID=UPI000935129D|nr:TetR/AcrR family transcriptional regulator [Rhodococcus yunnanensis]
MTIEADAPKRGRRRSGDADRSLLDAALDVLAEKGYGDFTMGAVIERAGTSSATLYRRWQTKDDLVGAALATLAPALPELDTGSLQGDLSAFVRFLADAPCVDPKGLDDGVIAELGRNPQFHRDVTERFIAPRKAALEAVLARALVRGEIEKSIDCSTAYSIVCGPIQHRVQNEGKSLDPQFLADIARAAYGAVATLGAAVK